MNRQSSFAAGTEPLLPPAIDLVADSDDQLARVGAFVERLGIEVVDRHRWQDITVDKLGHRPVWIELDEDPGTALDRWLMAFDARSDSGEFASTIAMPPALLDPVSSVVGNHVDLVVAPDEVTRASALSMLAAQGAEGSRAAEAGSNDPEALRRLSDEVQRIAAALARMSDGGYQTDPATHAPPTPAGADADLDAETVRSVIRARRLRADYFDADLFHDPAWDMMLDLLAAEIAQHRVPVSSLCMAAAVPPTTALRWMKTLTDKKIFLRRSDPHDGRRVFVELSEQASGALRAYFAKLAPRLAI